MTTSPLSHVNCHLEEKIDVTKLTLYDVGVTIISSYLEILLQEKFCSLLQCLSFPMLTLRGV